MDAELRNIYLEGKNNDFNFVKELFKQGRIRGCNPHTTALSIEDFMQLKSLIAATQDLYPDSWNLEIIRFEQDSFIISGLTIYFPELELENTYGEKLPIFDVFMRLELSLGKDKEGFRILGAPSILRSTQSIAEFKSGFLHSHCSSNSIFSRINVLTYDTLIVSSNFSSFCVGNGSIMESIDRYNSIKSTDKFQTVLLELLKMASWESLEGGPYKNMSNVLRRLGQNSNTESSGSTLTREGIEATLNNFTETFKPVFDAFVKTIAVSNPSFYLKFIEKKHQTGYSSFEIQNEREFLENLVRAFKLLVSSTENPFDNISIGRTEGEGVNFNINLLSNIFTYSTVEEPEKFYDINPDLLYIEDTDDSESRTIIDVTSGVLQRNPNLRADGLYVFRGREIKSRIIDNAVYNNDSMRINRLNLENVHTLRVKDHYKSVIMNIIKKNLKENVAKIRN